MTTENPPRAMMATRGQHHGGADDARAECATAAMALLGGASQPAGGGDFGQPGSENSGEGGVVSKPVVLEDHSVRRSVERGGRIHDQRGQARCPQPACELLRVVGDYSTNSVARAYADRDGNVVAVVGTELQGARQWRSSLEILGGADKTMNIIKYLVHIIYT